MLVMAYNKSFRVPTIITRGNNVYGPRQYPEKVIPKFILQGLNNEPMTIHGNGSSKRSFLYVSDVADAFMKILSKGIPGQIFNIGVSNEFSVSETDFSNLLVFGNTDRRQRIHLDIDFF